jgi:glycosyltransferase involved in cell wall biosynthesis
MKITYLANIRLPTERAHGYQIMKSCEALAREGCEVVLVVPRRRNPLGHDPFGYYHLPKTFTIRFVWSPDFFRLEWVLGSKAAFALNRMAFFKRCFWLRLPPDAVVFSRDPELVFLARLCGHAAFYNAHNFPKHPKLLLWLIKRASGIVANSHGTAEEFLKRGFKNVLVLPNAVDLAEFDAVPDDKEMLRHELGLPEGKPLALYAGHLYGWKGTELLLEAARLRPEINFVIVGGMPEEINRFRTDTSEKAIDNLFLVGYQPRYLIPKFLKAADVLVLPNTASSTESLRYTSPLKLFEYLASGRAIAAADLSSLREIVTEKEVSFFTPDDVQSLARAIDGALAREPDHAARLLSEKYSWTSYGEKLRNFLQN